MFSAFLSLLTLWISFDIVSQIIFIIGIASLLFAIMVYIRIYFVVRRHKNQFQAVQVQVAQNCEMANFANLIKSVGGIFYVYLVFLLCYLPYFICLAAIEFDGTIIALKKLFLISYTLVFLNSSLNPVIYCWKMRHIRHAVINILRNMSWLRNCASHLS